MGKQPHFDDAALQAAATQTAESLLSSLPAPSACQHVFSELFLKKIDVLLQKRRRRAAAQRMWQRVAVVFLVALLSAATWLSVDVQAREKLFHWSKEIFENMFVYRIDGGNIEKTYCGYEPTWLPDGFTLADRDHSDEFGFDYYYYENKETGQILVIDITFMKNGAMTITPQETGEPTYHDINGVQGVLYPPNENSTLWSLILIDEEKFAVFIIEGNIPERDILHIARGIIPSNLTK